MNQLRGRTALVTGAGRGIGLAIAQRLARDGAAVAINYSRSAKTAEAAAAAIVRAGGTAFAVRADLADLGQIETMVSEIEGRLGGLDILINNAGRGSGGLPTLATSTVADYEQLFGLNTRGLFFTAQAAARILRDGGRIVNISSNATVARMGGLSLYAGSKAAVEAFTRVWATELAPRGILVNCVSPGMVETDLIRDNMPPDAMEMMARRHPLGRNAQPEDLADVVAFLCGTDSRWINGQVLIANGGI